MKVYGDPFEGKKGEIDVQKEGEGMGSPKEMRIYGVGAPPTGLARSGALGRRQRTSRCSESMTKCAALK